MALLSTEDVAQRLRISRRRVQWYCKQGRIEAERVGRDYAVTEEAFRAFEAQERKPGPKGPRKE